MLLDYWVLPEHEYMSPNWTHAEGFILGVGAKMFTIAGTLIVYGLIYWVTTMEGKEDVWLARADSAW